MRIDKETWKKAQDAERRFHRDPVEVGLKKYKHAYEQYFEWLGMDFDLDGKSVIEIGCADIPALYFCLGGGHKTIIEPMPSSVLTDLCPNGRYRIIRDIAEALDFKEKHDEVWMFNLLQHVVDPDKLIENSKGWADTIRFFEPVDQEINDCHPHAPTQEDFKRWFGDSCKLYEGNPDAVNFHTANCMYGTWNRETEK